MGIQYCISLAIHPDQVIYIGYFESKLVVTYAYEKKHWAYSILSAGRFMQAKFGNLGD